MRLYDPTRTGPACRFGDAHIYYVLHILSREGIVSRGRLAEMLGIGEGSVRPISGILRRWGLIEVKQSGVYLTEDGRSFLRDISMRMVDAPYSDYVLGAYQQGILVSGVADRITDGMYQRDRGIIAGASGASVFMMKDDSVIMPRNWNMDYRDPDFAAGVRSTGIGEDDVLVISGASDRDTAVISAIAIGLDLL